MTTSAEGVVAADVGSIGEGRAPGQSRSPGAPSWSVLSSVQSMWAGVVTVFVSTFLPFGFPDSVAPEYARFQVSWSIQLRHAVVAWE